MKGKEEFEEVMDKLLILVEKEAKLIPFDVLKKIIIDSILEFKGKEIYGVFYKFGTTLTTREGDLIVDEVVHELAENIAKKGFVVIAGDSIFENINGYVYFQTTTIKAMKKVVEEHSEKDSLEKISDLLASLVPYAIFILLNVSSTSHIESTVFHKKEHLNKKNVSMVFRDELPKNTCKFLNERKSKQEVQYLICESNDFKKLCKTEEKNCFFTKQIGISASEIQKHINARDSKLIVTDRVAGVHNLILELMEHDR